MVCIISYCTLSIKQYGPPIHHHSRSTDCLILRDIPFLYLQLLWMLHLLFNSMFSSFCYCGLKLLVIQWSKQSMVVVDDPVTISQISVVVGHSSSNQYPSIHHDLYYIYLLFRCQVQARHNNQSTYPTGSHNRCLIPAWCQPDSQSGNFRNARNGDAMADTRSAAHDICNPSAVAERMRTSIVNNEGV